MLNEESEPLGLRVSWVKTKIQAFNDILDAAVLSVPVCGEDVEVTERKNSAEQRRWSLEESVRERNGTGYTDEHDRDFQVFT